MSSKKQKAHIAYMVQKRLERHGANKKRKCDEDSHPAPLESPPTAPSEPSEPAIPQPPQHLHLEPSLPRSMEDPAAPPQDPLPPPKEKKLHWTDPSNGYIKRAVFDEEVRLRRNEVKRTAYAAKKRKRDPTR